MLRFQFLLLILFVVITSCEKTIDPVLPQTDNRLVVEGVITNEETAYTIKLSRTQKYSYMFNTSNVLYEKGAKVILSDNAGNIDTLIEVSSGIFKSHTTKIIGTIGRSYRLDIYTADGKHYYTALQEMQPVPEIDSIYFSRNHSEIYQGNSEIYRYNVFIDWNDVFSETNYYMFIISYYWDNKWQQQVQWNNVMRDFKQGAAYYKKINMSTGYGQKFKVKVNMYSINKATFDYWRILFEQKETDFDGYVNNTVPIIGNIFNADDPDDYAIGFFQVSATSNASVYIDK